MFNKEMFRNMGIEIRNLIVDYTLSDGRRAHNAFQIFVSHIKVADEDIIALVLKEIPSGSRLCSIIEIKGDYELSELNNLATSFKSIYLERRVIYVDHEFAKEYVNEFLLTGKL